MAILSGLSIVSIGFKLLGAGKWLLGLIPRLVRWMFDHPWQSAVIALSVLSWWMWDGKRDAEQLAADNLERYQIEADAHSETIINVEMARRVAAELDRQNAERVRLAAEAVATKEREKYEIRIANLDDRAERLRQRLAETTSFGEGSSGTASMPGDPNATCRVLGATDCDDLVARMKDGQLSIDKLIGLQAYAAEIAAIDVNAGNQEAD